MPSGSIPAPAEYVPSWQPVDPATLLDDSYQGPKAELWPIEGGMNLLYRGAIHQFFGQPETWKSWLSLTALASVLTTGGRGCLVDAEDRAAAAVSRLLKLGVPTEAILHRLDVVEPSGNPHSENELDAFQRLVARDHDIVVIDSVTRVGALSGIKSNDQDSMTFWFGAVPSAFARRGAAVIVVDHVPKPNKDAAPGSERYAGGSNAKLGIVQVSYRISVSDKPTPRPGAQGGVMMDCTKDRHGDIKEHAERFFVDVDSRGEQVLVRVSALATPEPESEDTRVKNTRDAVIRALIHNAGGLAVGKLRTEAMLWRGKGNSLGQAPGGRITEAAEALVRDGVAVQVVRGAATVTMLTEEWKDRCRTAGIPIPDADPDSPPPVAWDPTTALAEPSAD